MALTVQFDEEQLDGIAKRFDEQGDSVGKVTDKLIEQVHVLEEGAWVGSNADAFTKRMNDDLLPGLVNLINALYEAARVTGAVKRKLQEADEQNKSYFPN